MPLSNRMKVLMLVLFLIIALGAGSGYYWWYTHLRSAAATATAAYQTPAEASDVYVRFDMEAYDAIVKNYWQTPSDADVSQLFLASTQKALSLFGVSSASTTLATPDRAGTTAMLEHAFSYATTTDAKATLATGILQVVLYNLPPNGRNELLSQSDQAALQQTVNNVNPSTDLYSDLGLAASSSILAVDAAYKTKAATLAASSSAAAKVQLAQVSYAHRVLSDAQTKARYDTSQVEPTVFSTMMGHTLYLYISKMSPTTLQEFQDALNNASTTPVLDSLIIDLRGNIGGSLPDATSFLSEFLGPNQYAFDLYADNSYNVVRTAGSKDPLLASYHDVALLTDDMTQSTAEVLTASLKRYHIAYSVGATTRGWGTVESTFPLTTSLDASTTYALLLVHAITLRDDQQPIQGRGVDPDVSLTDA
ncbi:MAG TPA: S41 family peptidase, partial [Candidatus Paceibacterota bacterium]|nr:S41 family peptidase [Candidatus Paceibacterota bacterium]